MAVTQRLTKHYEGLSTDDKPVGVIIGTTFRETDTCKLWITYDGDNWIVADINQADIVTAITGLLTDIVLAAGANIIGNVRIDQTTPGTTNGVVRVGGGLLNSGVLSGDTQVKASPGKVYWITISDTAALVIDLEDSSGSGTSKWGIDLPADGYGHFIFDPPIEFATGIFLDVSTVTCKVTVGYI